MQNRPTEQSGTQTAGWTAAKLALLEQLWRRGETAAVIAQQLGVSRSAVIGKIFRLRLSAAGSGMAPPQQRRRGRAQAPSSAVTPPAPLPPPPPPPAPARPSRGKSLLELTNGDCRWPIGNPGDKRFHFCGEPGADIEQGIPYCQQHMQRAYVASAPKLEKTRNTLGGWHTISPGISASVWRMFRDAIARKERT